MTTAKLAYLTTPSPNVYVLNIQVEGEDIQRFEISKAHLINISVDGINMALREQYPNRVQPHQTRENA